MATNYFWVAYLDRPHSLKLHIGLAEDGWEFLFRGNAVIRSWTHWKRCLARGGHIVDQDGNAIGFDDFCAIVERRGGENRVDHAHRVHPQQARHFWKDPAGYAFTEVKFS